MKKLIGEQIETVRQLREEHQFIPAIAETPNSYISKTDMLEEVDQHLTLCHLAQSMVQTEKVPTLPPETFSFHKANKRRRRHRASHRPKTSKNSVRFADEVPRARNTPPRDRPPLRRSSPGELTQSQLNELEHRRRMQSERGSSAPTSPLTQYSDEGDDATVMGYVMATSGRRYRVRAHLDSELDGNKISLDLAQRLGLELEWTWHKAGLDDDGKERIEGIRHVTIEWSTNPTSTLESSDRSMPETTTITCDVYDDLEHSLIFGSSFP